MIFKKQNGTMRVQDGGALVQRPLAEPVTDLNCCKGFWFDLSDCLY